MKTPLRLLGLVLLGCLSTHAAGAPSAGVAAPVADVTAVVRAADDERVAATSAGDRARLDAIFSDELHYGHSTGKVDTKASLITALTSRRSIYEGFEYKERTFTPVQSGVVLMTGRVILRIRTGEQRTPLDVKFLAVWRQENGRWRFLAWQSCKNAVAD